MGKSLNLLGRVPQRYVGAWSHQLGATDIFKKTLLSCYFSNSRCLISVSSHKQGLLTSSHKLMSRSEALFKFKLLGPHHVTAGKTGFQLRGPRVEVQMCLPGWREANVFGWGKHCLFTKTLAPGSSLLSWEGFFSHPSLVWTINSILHVQLGSRELQGGGN